MIYVVALSCQTALEYAESKGFSADSFNDQWYCVHMEFPFIMDDDEIVFLEDAKLRDEYEHLYAEAQAWWKLRAVRAAEDLKKISRGLEGQAA